VVAQAALPSTASKGGSPRRGLGENINEGRSGTTSRIPERNACMAEALEIMRRLLDGKAELRRRVHHTDRASCIHSLGLVPSSWRRRPKSAAWRRNRVSSSVKDPAETIEHADRAQIRSRQRGSLTDGVATSGRCSPQIRMGLDALPVAWPAGPGVSAVDPQTLRAGRRAPVGNPGRYNSQHRWGDSRHRPLVEDLEADIVTFQMASMDQPALIRLLGTEVLPRLRG
jgi:hypothetical protein